MNSSRTKLVLAGALLVKVTAALCAESPEQVRVRLFEQTKIVAVMGLPSGDRNYQGDGDPTTLEIVFLDKKADGPSRVSDNGEVIFLYKASDKTQDKLIEKAFDI